MEMTNRRRLSRRRLLRKAAGVAALGGIFKFTPEEAGAQTRALNTNSAPSQLKITDMRACTVAANYDYPIIRIDTNQGIYGLGEVRDWASPNYALMLKSRILGENPCHVDKIFRKIKQFGGHARQGGGVCGIEMALWDLAGKAYNVPVYQMIGGKFRDKIRCYADTDPSPDPKVYARRMKARMDMGFTLVHAPCLVNGYLLHRRRDVTAPRRGHWRAAPSPRSRRAW